MLKHLDVQPKSEAILPAYNYFVMVEQFRLMGFPPVFADIKIDDLNVDPNSVATCISPRSRFLLTTHMFGQPCDMDALCQLAKKHDLIMIEDCAHAFGSKYQGRHVGTFGRAGIFSLSAMKLITAYGGGVITTNDDQLAQRIRDDLARTSTVVPFVKSIRRYVKGLLLDIGTRTAPYTLLLWPMLRMMKTICPSVVQQIFTEKPRRSGKPPRIEEGRLAPFQAALGLSQIQGARTWIQRRRLIVEWMDATLRKQKNISCLNHEDATTHNGMYCGILVDDPANLARSLFKAGIDSEWAEYTNCADAPIYQEFQSHCPVASEVQSRILRLPSHPSLRFDDVERIAKRVRTFESRIEKSGIAWHSPMAGTTVGGIRVRSATRPDVARLAAIHAASLPTDFLVRIGESFLRRVFFPALLDSPTTRVYVAELDQSVVGLLVTRIGMGGVLGDMIRFDPISLLAALTWGVIRQPSLLRDGWGVIAQLRARNQEPDDPEVGELFLLAVDPSARRMGVARSLIHRSAKDLQACGICTYRVLLHADNEAADATYRSNGFIQRRKYDFAGSSWLEHECDLSIIAQESCPKVHLIHPNVEHPEPATDNRTSHAVF